MARLSCDSSSDDEFPNLEVIARRIKQKNAVKAVPGATENKENPPPRVLKTAASAKDQGNKTSNVPASLSKGTPLRRRKLGNPQAIDSSLFQKWSEVDCPGKQVAKEATAPKSRTSSLRTRETRRETPELSERSSQEPADETSESEDDVVVRRRRRPQQKPAVQVELRQQKTAATVSVTELKKEEEAVQVEESVEISAFIADDSETGEDETSEFVTALSLDSESESGHSEPDFLPAGRRSRSPSSRRLKALKPQQTLDPVKKENGSSKPSRGRGQRDSNADREPSVPQTPPRAGPRKGPAKRIEGDGLEETFKKLQIYAEDIDDSPEAKPTSATQLDPVTPKKSLQPSPFKAPKIPPSPWKPDHKEFWDAEIQNEWIDRHSPPKRASPKKLVLEATDAKALLKQKYGTSPEKRNAKKAFDQVKETLAEDFLRELDDRITQGQLAKLTASTGGMRIKWSTTLQSTAGRAHWKCKEVSTMTQQPDGSSLRSAKERRHEAWIELATKVLTNPDDLLNTVAHEFCHLAVFMLDGKPKSAHGPEFKAWGRKCGRAFGADRGIEVTTKHSYEIDYKFIWRCAECACEVHRHSKSVDPARQRCGRCRGALEQVKPLPRAAAGKKTAYQEFVGREMRAIKAEGGGAALAFKDMMAVVSGRWKALQRESGGKEGTPDGAELRGLEEQFQELGVADLGAA